MAPYADVKRVHIYQDHHGFWTQVDELPDGTLVLNASRMTDVDDVLQEAKETRPEVEEYIVERQVRKLGHEKYNNDYPAEYGDIEVRKAKKPRKTASKKKGGK